MTDDRPPLTPEQEAAKREILAAVRIALERSQASTSAPSRLVELVGLSTLTPEDVARIAGWLEAAGPQPEDADVIHKLQGMLPLGHELRDRLGALLRD